MTPPANIESFHHEFKLVIEKDCVVNAIVGWFDVEMTPGVWLSTSPLAPITHWRQTVFPLLELKHYLTTSTMEGKIDCRPPIDDYRALAIRLEIRDQIFDESTILEYHIR